MKRPTLKPGDRVGFHLPHLCHETRNPDSNDQLSGKHRIVLRDEPCTVLRFDRRHGRVLTQMDRDGFYSWSDLDFVYPLNP